MENIVEISFKPIKDKTVVTWWTLTIIKWCIRVLYWVCVCILCYCIVPVIEGDVELDHPLTNSQITAIMGLIALLYMSRKVG